MKSFILAVLATFAISGAAFAQQAGGVVGGFGGGTALASSDSAGFAGSAAVGAFGQGGFARTSNNSGSANFAGAAIGLTVTADNGPNTSGGSAAVTADTLTTSSNFSNSRVVTGGVGAGAAFGFGTGFGSADAGGAVGVLGGAIWN